MRSSVILARVAARTGAALWRHRTAWLMAVVVITALGVYQFSYARPSVSNGDCADTAMAAVSKVDDAAARAAYACLDASMQRTSEDAFVAQLRQRSVPTAHVRRVAERDGVDGGRIVFYTVEAAGQEVGYIVYLGPDGKVHKIE